MPQLLPGAVPLLLERVQVTYRCLCQADAQLGASFVLFEYVAAVRSKHCKRALKTVRTMGELAASLLTLDAPASLTVGLRLRLGLLVQSTEKAAMQLVLAQSCSRRDTAIASWLHQQACAYLDAVLDLNRETLRELARVATRVARAASDNQQQASLEGAGNNDPPTTIQVLAEHG